MSSGTGQSLLTSVSVLPHSTMVRLWIWPRTKGRLGQRSRRTTQRRKAQENTVLGAKVQRVGPTNFTSNRSNLLPSRRWSGFTTTMFESFSSLQAHTRSPEPLCGPSLRAGHKIPTCQTDADSSRSCYILGASEFRRRIVKSLEKVQTVHFGA